MRKGKNCLYFCSAEKDSLYAMQRLKKQKASNGLSEWEARQLSLMEKRVEEGNIYLMPAVVYAAANQKSCESWMGKAEEKQRQEWYLSGVAWLRRCPAFLERFGWKERKNAIMAAGILSAAESGAAECARETMSKLLGCGWKFLWERIRQSDCLDAKAWKEMLEPWRDSVNMSCAMSGVLLLMATLQEKPVHDRDQLWRDLQRLRMFCLSCMKKPEPYTAKAEAFSAAENEKLEWLLEHFKNPQKLCCVQEKGRFDSEWQEQLFRVMKMAGLPASACETVTLSCSEVRMLLGELEGRMSPQKYMTFLALYTVSKELAQAGRAAAAADMPGYSSIVMKKRMDAGGLILE